MLLVLLFALHVPSPKGTRVNDVRWFMGVLAIVKSRAMVAGL